jgi:hypothetical protein
MLHQIEICHLEVVHGFLKMVKFLFFLPQDDCSPSVNVRSMQHLKMGNTQARIGKIHDFAPRILDLWPEEVGRPHHMETQGNSERYSTDISGISYPLF